ncbi:hypothetical protein MKK65_00135 [Methylobacterium sp. J-001]|uniref:hypothetical protein n=1 Tax=Methylobacterium sp. J-001 TaxID=2836609 RepID=UPI001FB90C54|nr:hypothetical protein [Methylobacterium sp. J-001]MCJ2115028.1 hypothetical protein [Methylobacterium sp. J-001]
MPVEIGADQDPADRVDRIDHLALVLRRKARDDLSQLDSDFVRDRCCTRSVGARGATIALTGVRPFGLHRSSNGVQRSRHRTLTPIGRTAQYDAKGLLLRDDRGVRLRLRDDVHRLGQPDLGLAIPLTGEWLEPSPEMLRRVRSGVRAPQFPCGALWAPPPTGAGKQIRLGRPYDHRSGVGAFRISLGDCEQQIIKGIETTGMVGLDALAVQRAFEGNGGWGAASSRSSARLRRVRRSAAWAIRRSRLTARVVGRTGS